MNILPPLTDDIVVKHIIGKNLNIWVTLLAIPFFARKCMSDREWWNNYFGYTNVHFKDDRACKTCKHAPTLEHTFECALLCKKYYTCWGWNDISCERPFITVSNTKLDFCFVRNTLVDGISFEIDTNSFKMSLDGEIFSYEQREEGFILRYDYEFGEADVSCSFWGEEVKVGNDEWSVIIRKKFDVDNFLFMSLVKNGLLYERHGIEGTLYDAKLAISQLIKDTEVAILLMENIPAFLTNDDIKRRLNRKLFTKALDFYHKTYQNQNKSTLPNKYHVYYCAMCDFHVAIGCDEEKEKKGLLTRIGSRKKHRQISMKEHCGCDAKVGLFAVIKRGKSPGTFFENNFIDKFVSKGGNGAPMWMQKMFSKGMRLEEIFGIKYDL